MHAQTPPRLAPRILLVFAVLACLFGWGQSLAEAAGHQDHSAPPAAVAGHGTADPAEHGKGGHGASHEHAVTCMASSATAAFGVLAAPEVAALVVTAVAPQTRLRESVLAFAEQRAPSIATLCVQRT